MRFIRSLGFLLFTFFYFATSSSMPMQLRTSLWQISQIFCNTCSYIWTFYFSKIYLIRFTILSGLSSEKVYNKSLTPKLFQRSGKRIITNEDNRAIQMHMAFWLFFIGFWRIKARFIFLYLDVVWFIFLFALLVGWFLLFWLLCFLGFFASFDKL